MNWRTKITRTDPDGLKQSEWAYCQRDGAEFKLDWIIHMNRPTKRHGWRIAQSWSRIEHRRSTIVRTEPPQEIKDEVVLRFCKDIKFT